MPSFPLTYLFDFLIAFAGAAAVYAYWVANRRRIAAETIGRAEEQSRTLLREAHPDHGGVADDAAQRIADLSEARRILLAR